MCTYAISAHCPVGEVKRTRGGRYARDIIACVLIFMNILHQDYIILYQECTTFY